MIAMLTAGTVAFAVAIFGTAYAIRLFRAWNIGQFIQQELEGHMHKSGTPTMGGIVIIAAILCGYTVSQFRVRFDDRGINLADTGFETSGLLVIGAIVGMGVVGFIDDYQKLSRFRNKGLGISAKLIGQLAVAGLFTWGAVVGGASTALAFTRPTALDLGAGAFAIWVLLLLTGFANAVNFTERPGRAGIRIGGAGGGLLHDHRLLDIPAPRDISRGREAWVWRPWRPRSWAPPSAFSGGTPVLPG